MSDAYRDTGSDGRKLAPIERLCNFYLVCGLIEVMSVTAQVFGPPRRGIAVFGECSS